MTFDLYINGNHYDSGFENISEAMSAASNLGDWVDEVEIMTDCSTTVWCWPHSTI